MIKPLENRSPIEYYSKHIFTENPDKRDRNLEIFERKKNIFVSLATLSRFGFNFFYLKLKVNYFYSYKKIVVKIIFWVFFNS